MKRTGIIAVCGLAAVFAYHFVFVMNVDAQNRIVRAERFELTDSRGTIRARITLEGGSQRTVYFDMLDGKGELRFSVHVPDNGEPSIMFLGSDGSSITRIIEGGLQAGGPQTGSSSGPRIGALRLGSGKADSANEQDVRYLQSQIDSVAIKLNELITRVNQL